MKLGIIAGNRSLPLLLAKRIKEKDASIETVVFAFCKETSPCIKNHVDRIHWLGVGQLKALRMLLLREQIQECIMIGQINPLRIFQSKNWDAELKKVIQDAGDFRPHTIFGHIIKHLEGEGVGFLDSTTYLKDDLATEGALSAGRVCESVNSDIDFGTEVISRFVELDAGQTVLVKGGSVVAFESLEGTDRTIKRGARLAGKGCTVLKFSKATQDMRFDVPVVGISTLQLLKRIQAASLVLESEKVIILEKKRFLSLAGQWGIPIVGRRRL